MSITAEQYESYYSAADEAITKIRAIEGKYYGNRSQRVINIFDDEIGPIIEEVRERRLKPETPGALTARLGTLLRVRSLTRRDDVAAISETLKVVKAWLDAIEPLAKLMR